jgi:hypothetical protein
VIWPLPSWCSSTPSGNRGPSSILTTSDFDHGGRVRRLPNHRQLRWDPQEWHFVEDAEANKWLDRERREGYPLPKV